MRPTRRRQVTEWRWLFAPNSPLRAAAVALAAPAQQATAEPAQPGTGLGVPGVVPQGNALPPTPEPVQPKRAAHYLWAVLIARIYEVFPLLCPMCGGQMRLIAFVAEGTQIRRILDHIGVDPEPPHIAPARGPPLWEDCDAQTDHGVQIEPDWATDWDGAAQPAPDFEVDQRVNWCMSDNGDFESLRDGSVPGTRRAPQITLLNTKPWW